MVTDSVVEDCAQLIMNRFQVRFGIGLTILGIAVSQQFVLLKRNVLGGDLAHTFLAEIGDKLGINNIVFH